MSARYALLTITPWPPHTPSHHGHLTPHTPSHHGHHTSQTSHHHTMATSHLTPSPWPPHTSHTMATSHLIPHTPSHHGHHTSHTSHTMATSHLTPSPWPPHTSHHLLAVVTDSPSLSSCVLLLGGADGDQVTTSCQPSNLTSPILTNIRPHLLQGMWEGLYTVPMPLPPRPAYISSDGFDVGVAISEIVTSLYRAASKYCYHHNVHTYMILCSC